MITYRELWAADPAAWRAAGAAWRAQAGPVERRAEEIGDLGTRLRTGWSGDAARAAGERLRGMRSELVASRPAFVEVDQILAGYAARLDRAKRMLTAAVTVAAATGLQVDRHGRVSPDPAARRPDGPATAGRAGEVAGTIRAALALAVAADRETAGRLADLASAAATGWAVRPGPDRPPPGAGPWAVRQWWDGLTGAERRWLVAHEPALVGRLDGLPAEARDQANRLLLAARRSELLVRRAAVLAGPRVHGRSAEVTRLDAALDGLATLADRLADGTASRAYLLGLDSAGDGRAIVAVGDPDRADNVLTHVPGMTSDLAGIGDDLLRVDRLAARCAELGPAEQTATVLWLDYDAPDSLDEAVAAARARDAAHALHRFQEGLRAAHDGVPAQHTVLGHSYGSLVVGVAARDQGLAADSVVLLGSPGVGVEHAAELGLPPGRVWSSTARDDIVQYAALAPGEALRRFAIGVALPGIGAPLALGRPADRLWFGPNPSDREFGAEFLPSSPAGHSGYWDTGNPALDGMARIALTGTAG